MVNKRLLLASQSPRRREMITWLDIPVSVTKAAINEREIQSESPRMTAVHLAKAKAQKIASHKDNWILAADTVVDLNQVALGKPENTQQAYEMLRKLRNRSHWVHTGVALYNPTCKTITIRCVTTQVWMRRYSKAEIKTYVDSRDPMDKAGAYAIQNQSFHPVHQLERCYANVVGLPLCAVVKLLQDQNKSLTSNASQLCLEHFGYHCPAIDQGVLQ